MVTAWSKRLVLVFTVPRRGTYVRLSGDLKPGRGGVGSAEGGGGVAEPHARGVLSRVLGEVAVAPARAVAVAPGEGGCCCAGQGGCCCAGQGGCCAGQGGCCCAGQGGCCCAGQDGCCCAGQLETCRVGSCRAGGW